MSQVIDNRIVELMFDNSDFEKNTQVSMNTLKDLNKAINDAGSGKGLAGLADSVKGFSLDSIAKSIDTISGKFTGMEIAAITALTNIVNKAVDAGVQLVKSLTIAPVSQGFQEYELKMGSIQTIMAGTGESLETVNKYLDELNTYADKTIYSFADMTTNIGKFTNQGVKLEDAVAAIQGIANEAAVSGANAEQASHAMYNFAQALSAGYVKLIDWKSIENAMMATKEFKEQLLDTAVALGTVTKEGDKFRSTTTNAKGDVSELFSATTAFNDNLQYQWLTTDVLTKTLAKYADETTDIGKKAFAAAQDVKTFTQLMDTLKEAVGSGWARSFEIIFGDFEEAKSMWTSVSNAVGGFIDKQAEARNEMLQTWDELGGRQAILDGFANTWNQVQKIIEPIKKAFKDIFPADTAHVLADISKRLGDLLGNFKITTEISDKLYRTFHGLFAILDIGKQAFTAMVNAIKSLGSSLNISISDILEFTAKIGDFFTELDNSIKSMGLFNNIFAGIKNVIGGLVGVLGEFGSAVGKNLQSGMGFISSVVDAIKNDVLRCGEAIEKTKEQVTGAIDTIKKSIAGSAITSVLKIIWEMVTNIGEVISTVITKAVDMVSKTLSGIMDAIKAGNSDLLFQVLNEGLLITFVNKLISVKDAMGDVKTMFEGLSKGIGGIGTTLGNIGGIFDGLGDVLEKMTHNIQAETILKIAGAVALLALSAMMLESIDADKVGQTLGTMTALLGELITIMSYFNTNKTVGLKNAITGWIDARSASTVSSQLIKLATALLILSVAMKSLSELDLEQAGIGLGSIAGLMLVLVGSMKLMPKDAEFKKISNSLITLGIAMNILAAAFKIFASVELEELGVALGGFAGTLASVVGAMGALSLIDDKHIKKNAQAIEKMGVAMILLGAAFKIFASLELGELGIAIGGFVAALVSVVGALGALSLIDDKSIRKNAKALETMGIAMIILGAAFKIFGSLELNELLSAVLGFAGALAIVVAALGALSLIDNGNLNSIAASVLIMSVAITVLGGAMKIFGSMSWGEIAKGLVGMAGALLLVVVALEALKNIKPENLLATAAAIVVLGAGLHIMADVIAELGSLSLAELAKGIGALAASLVLMFAGLKIFSGGGASLLVTASALLVLSVAIDAFALAIKGLSTIPLGAMAIALGGLVVGFAAIAGLAALLQPAVPAMLLFAAGLGAISAAVALFGGGILALGTGLGMLATAVNKMGSLSDKSLEMLKKTLMAALEAVTEVIPDFIQALLDGFIQILESFNQALPLITETIATLITSILAALNEKLPAIIDAVIVFLTMLMTKLTEAIPVISKKATEIIVAFINAISKNTVRIVDAAMKMIIDFINGLSDALEKNTPLFTDAVKRFFETVIKTAVAVLVGSIPFIKTTGADIMNGGFIEGLKSKISSVIQVGRDFINGFVNGVKEKVSAAVNTVKEFGGNIIDSLKHVFDEHSPSKVTDLIGRNFDQGLINGIRKLAGKAVEAAKEMGEDTLDALDFNNISSVIDIDSFNPVITPTMDLSNVQNGVNTINNMLRGKSMSATVDAVLEAGNNNNSVISELKDEVIRLGDRIAEMQIVLDSGTMVGAMTNQIDTQLGRRKIYAGRGI